MSGFEIGCHGARRQHTGYARAQNTGGRRSPRQIETFDRRPGSRAVEPRAVRQHLIGRHLTAPKIAFGAAECLFDVSRCQQLASENPRRETGKNALDGGEDMAAERVPLLMGPCAVERARGNAGDRSCHRGAAGGARSRIGNRRETERNRQIFGDGSRPPRGVCRLKRVRVRGGVDGAGEKIASVNDFVLSDDGKIDAIIVDFGGFLGIGTKQVAVAFEGANVMADDNNNRYLVVNTSKEQLEAQPAYNKDDYAANRDTQLLKTSE